MNRKKLVRERFRYAVFYRDHNRCRMCGDLAVDAHHIISRDIMPYGGYVKENGISLCEECHIKAETHYAYPIQSTKIIVQSHWSPFGLFEMIESNEKIAREACERLKDV